MTYTMVRRIWLGSGMRHALLCCTDNELRGILDVCEEYLAIRGIRRDERREIEDWRSIVLDELLRGQLERMIHDNRRRAGTALPGAAAAPDPRH